MEPKFQSSFIPKGPLATSVGSPVMGRGVQEKSLLAYLSLIIFIVSIVMALGAFGYKSYLKYRIGKMGVTLEQARMNLEPETIRELTRVDSRIISTKELLSKHVILSPLFEFLERSTPKTVRFNELSYALNNSNIELNMRGEARGYAALALASDIFNKSGFFTNPVFSDLSLNSKGDVIFSFSAILDPSLVTHSEANETVVESVAEPVTEIEPIQ